MQRKSLIFNSILSVSIIFGSLLYHSCTKDENSVQNVEENQIELPFSKTINLTDEYGNTLSFDLYSDDKTLIDSYSEANYTFKGMTQEDINRQNEIDALNTNEGGDEEEYIEDEEAPITFVSKNMKLNLKDGFVGYSIEEEWYAPEEIQDRSFSWHNEPDNTHDYAKIHNNRCCWSIYATWQYKSGSHYYDITVNKKIRGGKTTDYYGMASSAYIRLQIKYRRASHRTIYYSNTK